MPRRVVVTLALAALAVGACSSQASVISSTTATSRSPDDASSSSVAPTSSEPTTSSVAIALEVLDPTLLGPRFRSAEAPISAEAADENLAELCPIIARARQRHDPTRRERVVMSGRDSLPTVSQDLSVYREANAAAAVFNALASDAMLRCLPKLVAESGLVLADVRVTRVPIDDVGDAAAAMRLRGTSVAGGLASSVDVELIVVNVGTAVQVVVVTSSDLFPLGEARRTAIITALGP